jgi:hypothetical protein
VINDVAAELRPIPQNVYALKTESWHSCREYSKTSLQLSTHCLPNGLQLHSSKQCRTRFGINASKRFVTTWVLSNFGHSTQEWYVNLNRHSKIFVDSYTERAGPNLIKCFSWITRKDSEFQRQKQGEITLKLG